MRRTLVVFLVLAVFVSFPLPMDLGAQERARKTPPVTRTAEPRALEASDIFDKYARAVVFVSNLNEQGQTQATGTGFIVSADGVIVTNYHVIDGASDAQIKLSNGEIYDHVRVLNYDRRRDIAVLQVRATGLPVVRLGDSEKVKVGEAVVAIGNPKGFKESLTTGSISQRRTDVQGMEGTSVLQTQTPISPGSSGGPLFNMRGEVIGITTAAASGEGAQNLNFAVEIKYAKLMLDNPPMNMSLAEVSAKENPRPAHQERASGGSNPPPSGGSGSTGGSSSGSTVFVGTDYTEPKGVVTITLKDGWREDFNSKKTELMYLTNSASTILIYEQTGRDAESLFSKGESTAKTFFVQGYHPFGKKVAQTLSGNPVAVQWFQGKDDKGKDWRLLVGIWVLPSTSVEFLGLVSETNDKDFNDVTDMFFSLRTASSGSNASGGGGSGGSGGTGTQSGNRYSDPSGYASLELQSGWGPDTSDKDANTRLMTLTNGRSLVWVFHKPNSTDARQIFDEKYESLQKNFVSIEPDSKMVDSDIGGRPVKAQWFILTLKDGSKIRVLLGTTVSRSGGLLFMGIIASDANADDRTPINRMFVTLE